jgi:hypothetical protein
LRAARHPAASSHAIANQRVISEIPGHHHFTFRHLPVIEPIAAGEQIGPTAARAAARGGRVFNPRSAVIAGTLTLAVFASARAEAKPTLIVKVYNAAGVAAVDLARAQEITQSILARAGIAAVWRDCDAIIQSDSSSTACAHPRTPQEVVVRLVADASRVKAADVLGFSTVGAHQIASLATVLADHVNVAAERTQLASGTLLGRVIAHEIGHLLLASSQHADAGLMRAVWRDDEIRRDLPVYWIFSKAEARQLRLAVASRSLVPQMTLAKVLRPEP